MTRMNTHLKGGVPNCPECDAPGVRWRGTWVCSNCFKLADAKPGYDLEGTPLGDLLPNRAARRAR